METGCWQGVHRLLAPSSWCKEQLGSALRCSSLSRRPGKGFLHTAILAKYMHVAGSWPDSPCFPGKNPVVSHEICEFGTLAKCGNKVSNFINVHCLHGCQALLSLRMTTIVELFHRHGEAWSRSRLRRSCTIQGNTTCAMDKDLRTVTVAVGKMRM